MKKLIHLSTDKAVNPTSTMGATKMLGERLCVSRELTKGMYQTIISCVRFGNVLGSRGSIIPLIKNQIKNENMVTLTDERMRRFFLSIPQAIELVIKSAIMARGGEIFVLKMPVIRIKDLIEVVIEKYSKTIGKDPNSIKINVIGPRVGEKIDEALISPVEFGSCYETEDTYIIYPLISFNLENNSREIEKLDIKGIKLIEHETFNYDTKNIEPLTKEQILELLDRYKLI